MKYIFIILYSSFAISHSFAQLNTNYRFSFGIFGASVMNYGLQDLKNIERPLYPEGYRIYKTEKYDLDYQNLAFSYGYGFNFSTYIFNNSKYSLKIGASLFFDKRIERLTYTLVDIGNGDEMETQNPISPYNSNNVQVGYSNTITFGENGNGQKGSVYGFDLIFSKKFKNNFSIGSGISYNHISRHDYFIYHNGYLTNYGGRGAFIYETKKIGIALEVNKSIGRINAFIKLNQTIFNVKKKENFGGSDFNPSDFTRPTSQNLDYRFPLIINIGIAVEFDKINKQK